jgi:hypothetical protein
MSLTLRNNLHWCDSGGRVVFLDVTADRYFCLSEPANQAFLRLAAGIAQAGDSELLQRLIASGVLIEAGEEGRIKSPPRIEEPTCDVAPDPACGVRPSHVLRALVSELRSTWELRTRPFATVLEKVGGRNRLRLTKPTCSSKLIRELVAGSAAAAFLMRSHNRCLVRALALYGICRKKGLTPQLVLGVNAHPFAAHCWVQLGSAVLVGGYEQARLYSPILVLE